MTQNLALCERYTPGTTVFGAELTQGTTGRTYLAVVHEQQLPRRRDDEHGAVWHGYAVNVGSWYFFGHREPALTFGRAAGMSREAGLMSRESPAYGVHHAALVRHTCEHHGDEHVLVLTGDRLDRQDGEADAVARFAAGVAQHPASAHWIPPAAEAEGGRRGPVETPTASAAGVLNAWLRARGGRATRREIQRARVAGARTPSEVDALISEHTRLYGAGALEPAPRGQLVAYARLLPLETPGEQPTAAAD